MMLEKMSHPVLENHPLGFLATLYNPEKPLSAKISNSNLSVWHLLKDTSDENRDGWQKKASIGSSFPDEVYYFHPIAFIEHLKKINPGITLKKAKKLALMGTSVFEGAWNKSNETFNYGVLASNFDGAGLSMGIIQWNIKSRNFFSLLKEMYDKNSSKFKECYENGNANRFKQYFENQSEWDTDKYDDIWDIDTFSDFIGNNRENNLKYQYLWAKLLHNTDKIKTTSGSSYKAWKNKSGVTHSQALKPELLDFFKNLGKWSEFQQIQYKSAAEGTYMKKAVEEIKWLREKTKTNFPNLMKSVELRSFAAMFDLCVQHGSLSKARSEIESKISSGSFSSQYEFMKMVITERAKKGNSEWVNNSVSRRMGFLNAKATKISGMGGATYEVKNVNYKYFEDNQPIGDFYD